MTPFLRECFKDIHMAKKKNKRKKYTTLLEIGRQVKNRQEELHIDYLHKIKDNKEAMDFLERFNREEVLASMPAPKDSLNKTKKDRKRVTDHNNARNRDLLINMKVRGMMDNILSDSHFEAKTDRRMETHYNNHEDDMVSVMDNREKLNKQEEDIARFQKTDKWNRKYAPLVKPKKKT
jgi:hypothetical protein